MALPGFPLIIDPYDERWLTFINSRTEANIFHHPAWTSLLAESYGFHPLVLAVTDSDGYICAGLPVMEINSYLTGRRWVSLPFTDHCTPLYSNLESLGRLSEGLVAFSHSDVQRKIELRGEFPPLPDIHPYSHFVLHAVQLNPDSESLFERFKSTKRQYVRAAIRRGVRIEWGTTQGHLQSFYRHHLYTRRKHGVPTQPWKFFELLGKNLLEKGFGFVLLAFKGNECIAGKICLHWQKTLTDKFTASDPNKLDLRPNHLLIWRAIQWGCAHGLTLFDLGRSDNDGAGLREFKSGWASEEKPLIYSTICTKPPEFISGKNLTVMNVIIRNSPIWVNRLIGELLYRHVG